MNHTMAFFSFPSVGFSIYGVSYWVLYISPPASCSYSPFLYFFLLSLNRTFVPNSSASVCCLPRVGMSTCYYLHDCHYFYRTALKGLNVNTSVSPLYA